MAGGFFDILIMYEGRSGDFEIVEEFWNFEI